MYHAIENENIILRNGFIGKSSTINVIGWEMMSIPKSFAFNVRSFDMTGGEVWSMRSRNLFPKIETILI